MKRTFKKLNKKYGLYPNTNWIKCKTCEHNYPSIVEEDYTDNCSDCEDLSMNERLKLKNKLDNTIIDNLFQKKIITEIFQK